MTLFLIILTYKRVRLSLCPPDLFGLPSRASHTFATRFTRLVHRTTLRFARVLQARHKESLMTLFIYIDLPKLYATISKSNDKYFSYLSIFLSLIKPLFMNTLPDDLFSI